MYEGPPWRVFFSAGTSPGRIWRRAEECCDWLLACLLHPLAILEEQTATVPMRVWISGVTDRSLQPMVKQRKRCSTTADRTWSFSIWLDHIVCPHPQRPEVGWSGVLRYYLPEAYASRQVLQVPRVYKKGSGPEPLLARAT